MAMSSAKVTADVVEASEFPDLAQRFHVSAVPKTVINDRVEFTGALPEDRFLAHILRAVAKDG